jgi:ferredoxin
VPELEEQVFFHLTGARANGALAPVTGMRPALFARFGDVEKLRYDFPLVLLAGPQDAPALASLSGLVDGILADVAPKGIVGERFRRNVLRIEREIRALKASGETGTLTSLWDRAVEALQPRGGAPLLEDAAKARVALKVDGEVAGFAPSAPVRLVTHVWRALETRRSVQMRRRIDTLALRLADLVKADYLRSEAGRHAATLQAGVGASDRDAFDFELMAKLLAAPSGAPALSPRRRARIERTLGALRSQRFFEADLPFVFAFDRVEDALVAYRSRLGAIAELVRAIAIAELELRGGYVEDKHDLYFDHFDATSLSPEDLALFPDYLVWLSAADAADRARIIEGLTSGAPLKILFATDDAFGLGAQLATTAMGLGDAFVLQSSAAQLYRVRDRIRAALEYKGPALLSVFVPGPDAAALPAYLVAAAATESRAFPTFSYDPSAGADWAQRFGLHDDPQPDRVWPEHELAFADERLQRTSETVAFTLADFAICDARNATHFARVSRGGWNDHLVPLSSWLESKTADDVPYVFAVDRDAKLYKLVVDERLILQVRRCAEQWHRLRELDDLKRERAAVAQPAAEPVAEAVAVAAAPAPSVAPEAEAPAAPSSDEAYIETPRCTTCNECTGVNPRMFAYNENKQAYIKDRKAGTYADLVQAAENCQVAIIHPGKPLDANEPGLEDLLKRAESFR